MTDPLADQPPTRNDRGGGRGAVPTAVRVVAVLFLLVGVSALNDLLHGRINLAIFGIAVAVGLWKGWSSARVLGRICLWVVLCFLAFALGGVLGAEATVTTPSGPVQPGWSYYAWGGGLTMGLIVAACWMEGILGRWRPAQGKAETAWSPRTLAHAGVLIALVGAAAGITGVVLRNASDRRLQDEVDRAIDRRQRFGGSQDKDTQAVTPAWTMHGSGRTGDVAEVEIGSCRLVFPHFNRVPVTAGGGASDGNPLGIRLPYPSKQPDGSSVYELHGHHIEIRGDHLTVGPVTVDLALEPAVIVVPPDAPAYIARRDPG